MSTTTPLRVAFYGRCASDDPDDASNSLAWQYDSCLRVLPPHAIVALFYDIGTPPANSTLERLPLLTGGRPRAGGIAELVAEAATPDRRFDHVITESPERLSRRTHVAASLLHHFAVHRVGVLHADEDIARQLGQPDPVDPPPQSSSQPGLAGVDGGER